MPKYKMRIFVHAEFMKIKQLYPLERKEHSGKKKQANSSIRKKLHLEFEKADEIQPNIDSSYPPALRRSSTRD